VEELLMMLSLRCLVVVEVIALDELSLIFLVEWVVLGLGGVVGCDDGWLVVV
jgi:hypothetical protein